MALGRCCPGQRFPGGGSEYGGGVLVDEAMIQVPAITARASCISSASNGKIVMMRENKNKLLVS